MSGGIFEADRLSGRHAEIEHELAGKGAWDQPARMQTLLKEKSRIENTLLPLREIDAKLSDIDVLEELSREEDGSEFKVELEQKLSEIALALDDLEFQSILSGERDSGNAILTINSGAGGTESQDWAQMLMRMYLRWAERKGFNLTITETLPGEEAGIKSATIEVEGPYAYGYLKAEAGVHRLVRISPFDANKRRHTSFCAVLVYPVIEDDIDIDIRDDDLKIDTYRASGAGGQHVNKTSSAVRITHIPSGIIVACQSERSQISNRNHAMKVLRARLFDMQARAKEEEMTAIVGEKKDIAWGSQIRSYVFQPYRMVKDHRTNTEVGNTDPVMDGDIDLFIRNYLLMRAGRRSAAAE
ncbi:MAG: peptide chain release factor 2 [Nitrospirae bacterium]|nr:peptide chain release factor 2 [Nitrospirota bacterium]